MQYRCTVLSSLELCKKEVNVYVAFACFDRRREFLFHVKIEIHSDEFATDICTNFDFCGLGDASRKCWFRFLKECADEVQIQLNLLFGIKVINMKLKWLTVDTVV